MIQNAKIITLIVFGLIFLNLSAQSDGFENDPLANNYQENRKFRIGLQFNPQVSWIKPNTSGFENEGSKVGFTYGLSTEFFLTKNYLFSTGLFIANLGGELSFQGLYVDNNQTYVPSLVKQTYSINYFEIPLTLKLRTNEIGYMTYFGQFGLTSSIKFKSTSDFTYPDINNQPKVEGKNTASDIFFTNLYLTVGGGAEYNISGNTSLMVGLTYNNGFILNLLDKQMNSIENGQAVLDANGLPVFSDKEPSANLSYIALNIGLYF